MNSRVELADVELAEMTGFSHTRNNSGGERHVARQQRQPKLFTECCYRPAESPITRERNKSFLYVATKLSDM
jgi:hypothetical protein